MAIPTKSSILNSNSGIWSSKLDARLDLDRYQFACRQLENYLIRPFGMVERRPGTTFIREAKMAGAGETFKTLWEFQVNTETGYLIEVGHQYMRFFRNGARVETTLTVSGASWSGGTATVTTVEDNRWVVGDKITIFNVTSAGPGSYNVTEATVTGVPAANQVEYAVATDAGAYTSGGSINGPYDIATVFTKDQVRDLQYRSINDVIYITHKDLPPYVLRRLSDTIFQINEVVFDLPPFRDENSSEITINPGAASPIGTNTTLAAAVAGVGAAWAAATYYNAYEYHTAPALSITGGTWAGGYREYTTSITPHGLDKGNVVTITGCGAAAWDIVDAVVTSVGTNTFKVQAADPATAFTTAGATLAEIYQCQNDHTSSNALGTAADFWNDMNDGKWIRAAVFESGNVGGYYRLGHKRSSSTISLILNVTGTSTSSLKVTGPWNFRTTGTFTGVVRVQRYNKFTAVWETVHEVTATSDRTIDIAGEEEEESELQIDYTHGGTASTPPPYAYLEADEAYIYGYLKVTAYTNSLNVNADIIKVLEGSTATDIWAEGSWSPRRGYPRTCDLFEQRIIYAGNIEEPLTLWGSQIGDFQDFEYGISDDDAFSYTIPATEQNPIEWIVGSKSILIGTGKEYGILSSGSEELPLTPTNAIYRVQEAVGYNNLKPLLIGPIFAGVERNGRRLREIAYDWESGVNGGFKAIDLNRLNDEISEAGIVDIGYAQLREPYIYAVMSDGTMGVLAYNRTDAVVGWSKFTTNGEFQSVAIIRGSDHDEVWVTVKRTINGSDKYYIERFNPSTWSDVTDAYYVDCGLTNTDVVGVSTATWSAGILTVTTATDHGLSIGDIVKVSGVSPVEFDFAHRAVTAVPSTTQFEVPMPDDPGTYVTGGSLFTATSDGLDHLEGEEVQVLVDGSPTPEVTVASGAVAFTRAGQKKHIGLAYDTYYQPMRLDLDSRTGNSQGRQKNITQIHLRVYKSVGCTISNGTKVDTVYFNDTADLMDVAVPLFTGEKRINWASTYGNAPANNDPTLIINQPNPLPLSILALIVDFTVANK